MNEVAIHGMMMSGDVLARWPACTKVFLDNGMACVGCVMAPFETLRECAANYGIDPDRFVDDIIRFLRLREGFGGAAAREENS
ncbi:MAG: DUF1858 domain-containing protein [Candidatus Eisenbacteria bacterium]|nr:DUF1858 domain-containing protein [Candidatus Eisenbacteria bacterium]